MKRLKQELQDLKAKLEENKDMAPKYQGRPSLTAAGTQLTPVDIIGTLYLVYGESIDISGHPLVRKRVEEFGLENLQKCAIGVKKEGIMDTDTKITDRAHTESGI